MARVYETRIWDVYTKQMISIEQGDKIEAIRLAECAPEASVITWQAISFRLEGDDESWWLQLSVDEGKLVAEYINRK